MSSWKHNEVFNDTESCSSQSQESPSSEAASVFSSASATATPSASSSQQAHPNPSHGGNYYPNTLLQSSYPQTQIQGLSQVRGQHQGIIPVNQYNFWQNPVAANFLYPPASPQTLAFPVATNGGGMATSHASSDTAAKTQRDDHHQQSANNNFLSQMSPSLVVPNQQNQPSGWNNGNTTFPTNAKEKKAAQTKVDANSSTAAIQHLHGQTLSAQNMPNQHLPVPFNAYPYQSWNQNYPYNLMGYNSILPWALQQNGGVQFMNTNLMTTPINMNANIPQGMQTPMNMNANIPQEMSTSMNTNANIPQGRTTPMNMNANIPQGRTTPMNMNANIPQGRTTPMNINANIPQGMPTLMNMNANIPQGRTTPMNMNANIPQGMPTLMNTNANIPQGRTTPMNMNANMPQGMPTLMNMNANIPQGRTTPMNTNANIPQGMPTLIHMNANIPQGNGNLLYNPTPTNQMVDPSSKTNPTNTTSMGTNSFASPNKAKPKRKPRGKAKSGIEKASADPSVAESTTTARQLTKFVPLQPKPPTTLQALNIVTVQQSAVPNTKKQTEFISNTILLSSAKNHATNQPYTTKGAIDEQPPGLNNLISKTSLPTVPQSEVSMYEPISPPLPTTEQNKFLQNSKSMNNQYNHGQEKSHVSTQNNTYFMPNYQSQLSNYSFQTAVFENQNKSRGTSDKTLPITVTENKYGTPKERQAPLDLSKNQLAKITVPSPPMDNTKPTQPKLNPETKKPEYYQDEHKLPELIPSTQTHYINQNQVGYNDSKYKIPALHQKDDGNLKRVGNIDNTNNHIEQTTYKGQAENRHDTNAIPIISTPSNTSCSSSQIPVTYTPVLTPHDLQSVLRMASPNIGYGYTLPSNSLPYLQNTAGQMTIPSEFLTLTLQASLNNQNPIYMNNYNSPTHVVNTGMNYNTTSYVPCTPVAPQINATEEINKSMQPPLETPISSGSNCGGPITIRVPQPIPSSYTILHPQGTNSPNVQGNNQETTQTDQKQPTSIETIQKPESHSSFPVPELSTFTNHNEEEEDESNSSLHKLVIDESRRDEDECNDEEMDEDGKNITVASIKSNTQHKQLERVKDAFHQESQYTFLDTKDETKGGYTSSSLIKDRAKTSPNAGYSNCRGQNSINVDYDNSNYMQSAGDVVSIRDAINISNGIDVAVEARTTNATEGENSNAMIRKSFTETSGEVSKYFENNCAKTIPEERTPEIDSQIEIYDEEYCHNQRDANQEEDSSDRNQILDVVNDDTDFNFNHENSRSQLSPSSCYKKEMTNIQALTTDCLRRISQQRIDELQGRSVKDTVEDEIISETYNATNVYTYNKDNCSLADRNRIPPLTPICDESLITANPFGVSGTTEQSLQYHTSKPIHHESYSPDVNIPSLTLEESSSSRQVVLAEISNHTEEDNDNTYYYPRDGFNNFSVNKQDNDKTLYYPRDGFNDFNVNKQDDESSSTIQMHETSSHGNNLSPNYANLSMESYTTSCSKNNTTTAEINHSINNLTTSQREFNELQNISSIELSKDSFQTKTYYDIDAYTYTKVSSPLSDTTRIPPLIPIKNTSPFEVPGTTTTSVQNQTFNTINQVSYLSTGNVSSLPPTASTSGNHAEFRTHSYFSDADVFSCGSNPAQFKTIPTTDQAVSQMCIDPLTNQQPNPQDDKPDLNHIVENGEESNSKEIANQVDHFLNTSELPISIIDGGKSWSNSPHISSPIDGSDRGTTSLINNPEYKSEKAEECGSFKGDASKATLKPLNNEKDKVAENYFQELSKQDQIPDKTEESISTVIKNNSDKPNFLRYNYDAGNVSKVLDDITMYTENVKDCLQSQKPNINADTKAMSPKENHPQPDTFECETPLERTDLVNTTKSDHHDQVSNPPDVNDQKSLPFIKEGIVSEEVMEVMEEEIVKPELQLEIIHPLDESMYIKEEVCDMMETNVTLHDDGKDSTSLNQGNEIRGFSSIDVMGKRFEGKSSYQTQVGATPLPEGMKKQTKISNFFKPLQTKSTLATVKKTSDNLTPVAEHSNSFTQSLKEVEIIFIESEDKPTVRQEKINLIKTEKDSFQNEEIITVKQGKTAKRKFQRHYSEPAMTFKPKPAENKEVLMKNNALLSRGKQMLLKAQELAKMQTFGPLGSSTSMYPPTQRPKESVKTSDATETNDKTSVSLKSKWTPLKLNLIKTSLRKFKTHYMNNGSIDLSTIFKTKTAKSINEGDNLFSLIKVDDIEKLQRPLIKQMPSCTMSEERHALLQGSSVSKIGNFQNDNSITGYTKNMRNAIGKKSDKGKTRMCEVCSKPYWGLMKEHILGNRHKERANRPAFYKNVDSIISTINQAGDLSFLKIKDEFSKAKTLQENSINTAITILEFPPFDDKNENENSITHTSNTRTKQKQNTSLSLTSPKAENNYGVTDNERTKNYIDNNCNELESNAECIFTQDQHIFTRPKEKPLLRRPVLNLSKILESNESITNLTITGQMKSSQVPMLEKVMMEPSQNQLQLFTDSEEEMDTDSDDIQADFSQISIAENSTSPKNKDSDSKGNSLFPSQSKRLRNDEGMNSPAKRAKLRDKTHPKSNEEFSLSVNILLQKVYPQDRYNSDSEKTTDSFDLCSSSSSYIQCQSKNQNYSIKLPSFHKLRKRALQKHSKSKKQRKSSKYETDIRVIPKCTIAKYEGSAHRNLFEELSTSLKMCNNKIPKLAQPDGNTLTKCFIKPGHGLSSVQESPSKVEHFKYFTPSFGILPRIASPLCTTHQNSVQDYLIQNKNVPDSNEGILGNQVSDLERKNLHIKVENPTASSNQDSDDKLKQNDEKQLTVTNQMIRNEKALELSNDLPVLSPIRPIKERVSDFVLTFSPPKLAPMSSEN